MLQKSGLPYVVDPGGGAFYGPKIDLKLTDAIGKLKTVPPDGDLVQTARALGISFGD